MIAEYIQKAYAKPAYENENFNTRAWPGLSMVKTALAIAGRQVESCSIADVHEKKIVLVSITGACDWWQFLRERQSWRKGNYRVICGGAGVLNIRPFLWAADVFVFGRAERLISDLIKCELAGNRLEDESIAYSDTFTHTKKFFSGKNFTFALNAASEGMATQLLDMITMRAIEEDAEVIKKISSSTPFWSASAEIKLKTLEKYIDIEKICKEYRRGEEPTAYLRSWWHND